MTFIQSEIEINASVEHVWAILIDVNRYSEWNPFTYNVQTTLRVGDPITFKVRVTDRFEWTDHNRIVAIEPERKLAWSLTLPRFLLSTDRVQTLEVLAAERTRYRTSADFGGMVAPIIVLSNGKNVQRGFDNLCRALKTRSES